MVTVLTDDEVARRLSAGDAVRWMGEAVDAHHRGDLIAPPRVHALLGDGSFAFTTGRLRGSWFGYRSYDTFPGGPGEQVVVVHDEHDGKVRAVAVGKELGPRRVGAIGAVAADLLAPRDAGIVGLVGAGVQAAMQVWGLAAVRTITELRVYSRDAARRLAFVDRVAPYVHGAVRAVDDAHSAVEGAAVVVLATSSPTPVIDPSWLAAGVYVTTLGPKQQGHAEFGLELADGAALLVTDSPAQIAAYDPPNVLVGSPHQARLVSLGSVRSGEVDRPMGPHRSVFFSVGLAGTEAFLLERLAAQLATG